MNVTRTLFFFSIALSFSLSLLPLWIYFHWSSEREWAHENRTQHGTHKNVDKPTGTTTTTTIYQAKLYGVWNGRCGTFFVVIFTEFTPYGLADSTQASQPTTCSERIHFITISSPKASISVRLFVSFIHMFCNECTMSCGTIIYILMRTCVWFYPPLVRHLSLIWRISYILRLFVRSMFRLVQRNPLCQTVCRIDVIKMVWKTDIERERGRDAWRKYKTKTPSSGEIVLHTFTQFPFTNLNWKFP